ncbi:hypothetical protein J3F83DRAFT_734031 [Trichoderma novae-zelandiae]
MKDAKCFWPGLLALRNFGWILPFTPADWNDNGWATKLLADTSSSQQADVDWRHYMLTCVKKDLPHVRDPMKIPQDGCSV